MKKRMVVMLVAVALFLTAIGGVKFRQIQAGMAMAASFQPPPEAVTTMKAGREEWPSTLRAIGTVLVSLGMIVLLRGTGDVIGTSLMIGAVGAFIAAFVVGRQWGRAADPGPGPGDDETQG